MKLKKKALKDLVLKLRGKSVDPTPEDETKTPEEIAAEEAAKACDEDDKEEDDKSVDSTEENTEDKVDVEGDEEDPAMGALKVLTEKVDLMMDGLATVLEMLEGSKAEDSEEEDSEEDDMDSEDEDKTDDEDSKDEDEEDKTLDELSDEEALKVLEDLDEQLEEIEEGAV